jgi:hypothetical protein
MLWKKALFALRLNKSFLREKIDLAYGVGKIPFLFFSD